ncbi:AbrB/MazE/SpoVT family DNA-binding domain-containing protein [Romboutsia sedimentorum]|uniref:AbrB/MazE/SpoVT family DNA-binding domain-containing protein n=1 Tax=Romboutsia sedimentorum TaxID=1368474 RepID=UPI0024DE5300|nr:AbrB/MazE/SpoVT family DNA-binding domain-containing protein [Romboutsia sedimentorum]MDK2584237.1 AbrB/MazE/SpoVT family DNA-binding domain-containing protein [Romboutsia sedimentorum]
MKEERNLKISFTKSGSGSESTRVSLPIKWIRELGITPDDREVEVTLEDDKIIISKKK